MRGSRTKIRQTPWDPVSMPHYGYSFIGYCLR